MPRSTRSATRRSPASRSPAPTEAAAPRSNRNVSEAATLRAQVVEFLDTLPGNVLLVSYKAAIEALIDDLPAHVATAHFGALRGLNAFAHCETVVVMGREQPSAQAIEALTRPFCATDPEPFLPVGDYVLQSRGRRMRDPDAPNVAHARGSLRSPLPSHA